MSTLLVAATKAEATYLPTELPLLVTGIGKTAAAASLARALVENPGITGVVNLGTAGALRDGLEGLHLPGTVLNHEISADALRALGYDPQESLDIGGGDETVLASGDMFVTDSGHRDRLAARAHLVDMEGYAVAWVCRAHGIPVRLVKHVSDNADEAAMDWLDVVDASAKVLGEWAERNLEVWQ